MPQKISGRTKKNATLSPSRTRQQKRTALRKVYGMWKKRRPDPIKELEKMREEWR